MTKFGGAVVAAITVIAAVAGIMALVVDPETPDINLAKQFLPYYFATAPQSPAVTWEQLTPGFRAAGSAQRGNPLTYRGYVDYFHKYSSIDAENVTLSSDHQGWYSTTVTYRELGKDPSVSHQQFELKCPWWSKFPLVHCSPKNVQLNASGLMPQN